MRPNSTFVPKVRSLLLPAQIRQFHLLILLLHSNSSQGIKSSLQVSTACANTFPSQPWYNNPLEPNPVNSQNLQAPSTSHSFPPTKSSTRPKSGSDPCDVSGGIALKPALAPVKFQFFMPGYTAKAFGTSSSIAFEASSLGTFWE